MELVPQQQNLCKELSLFKNKPRDKKCYFRLCVLVEVSRTRRARKWMTSVLIVNERRQSLTISLGTAERVTTRKPFQLATLNYVCFAYMTNVRLGVTAGSRQ